MTFKGAFQLEQFCDPMIFFLSLYTFSVGVLFSNMQVGGRGMLKGFQSPAVQPDTGQRCEQSPSRCSENSERLYQIHKCPWGGNAYSISVGRLAVDTQDIGMMYLSTIDSGEEIAGPHCELLDGTGK